MTNEEARARVAALLEERRGYEQRKRTAERAFSKAEAEGDIVAAAQMRKLAAQMADRIELVDRSLRELGAKGEAGPIRAEKRIPTSKQKAKA